MSISIKTVTGYQEQGRLFVEPDLIAFPSLASTRTRFGEAAEEVACKALGLTPIPTDGRFDICFDAQDTKGNFFEIKSVRRTGAVPLWNWRIEKDQAAKVPLFYVLVTHDASVVKDSLELWGAFSETVKDIFIIPLAVMVELHKAGKTVKVKTNKEHGSMRKGYCRGYRNVSVKSVKNYLQKHRPHQFQQYGLTFNTTIHTLI